MEAPPTSSAPAPPSTDAGDPAETTAPRWLESPGAIATLFLLAPFAAFPPIGIVHGLLDGGDDATANLPELVYSGRKLLHGDVLWSPDLWFGHPILGEPEFATLYLPKLLLQLGPAVPLYVAYVLLHFVLAELTAFLYVRHLGIGRRGAVFGAVAYAFTGFMLGHRGHTMYVCAGAWAPLSLLLLDRAEQRGRGIDHLLAALVFALLPFSGAVQLTVYLGGLALLLALVRAADERSPRPLLATALALVPGGLLSLVQILPSMDLSRQLATELRNDPGLAGQAFHPALFPTIFLPMRAEDVELYSRAGVVVVCAAVLAIRSFRTAPGAIRAWAVAAAVALVLMLGPYVPFLSRILQSLPILSVFRIPTRHNFELGFALAVLGAYGVDRLGERDEDGARWVRTGAVVATVSLAAIWIGSKDRVTGARGAVMARQVTGVTAAGAALAFGAWLLVVDRRSRFHLVGRSLLPVVALGEVAWSQQTDPLPFRDFRHLAATAASALPERGTVRLLPRPLFDGSVDSFSGNTNLFHADVQNLLGYASITYSSARTLSARTLFDLDMFGQANSPNDLAWSTLPSVFGVTHVVLPHVVCGEPLDVHFDGGAECSSRPAAYPPVLRGEARCSFVPPGTPPEYAIELEARSPGSDTPGFGVGLFNDDVHRELFVRGKELHREFVRLSMPVAVRTFASNANFGGENAGDIAVFLRDVRFVERTEHVLTDLARTTPARVVNAEMNGDRLRLAPAGGLALVERRIERPRGDGSVELRVRARLASGPPSDVVLDLYDDGGYDPDSAQLVVPAAALRATTGEWQNEISLAGAPDPVSLRVLTLGTGVIEVETASIEIRGTEVVSRFPVTRGPAERRVTVRGNDLEFGPHAIIGGRLHLPVRPYEVRFEGEMLEPGAGELSLSVDRTHGRPTPLERSPKVRPAPSGRFVETFSAHEPPDEPRLVAGARFGAAPGTSAGAALIHRLEVRDACSLRHLVHPKPLANGLFLYENADALPRAYAVGSARVEKDPDKIRNLLRALSSAEIGKRAIVDEALPETLTTGTVVQAAYAARDVDVTVRAPDGPTLLVVNDRYDPGWGATIDGKDAPLLRVNGFVRGVVLPRGEHRVHLHYRVPASVWAGLASALSGVLFALFLAPPLARRLRAEKAGRDAAPNSPILGAP